MSRNEVQIKIQAILSEHIVLAEAVKSTLTSEISQIGQLLVECFERGNKVLLCGNGGSAADAQHLAAEFTGRFVRDRRALAAIALTTDTSALTAIANDFGFETIFSRQVEALAVKGDVVIGISTSGNSENVRIALGTAQKFGCLAVALLGSDGGTIARIADKSLVVPSRTTARVQEIHIIIGHMLCEIVDSHFSTSR